MWLTRSAARVVVSAVLVSGVWSSGMTRASVEDVIDAMASRLEHGQVKEGPDDGLWESEPLFTGTIAAGLVCAVECTESMVYKAACNSAGLNIVTTTLGQGNLLGDEAYALVRLRDITDFSQGPSVWTTDYWGGMVAAFYESIRDPAAEGSTEAYLAYFKDMEPSVAVYYLAHHVLAVYRVDDIDRKIWRDGLIRHLSLVDDTCDFPVLALGAATWALAETEKLDDTPVASEGSSTYWDGIVLSDLPALLLSHQVPEGGLFAGSFYWRFDHSAVVEEGIAVGFTEDAAYGTLGLVAAATASDDMTSEEMVNAITAAQHVLLSGVDEDGNVYQHLARLGEPLHVYAGEMLQAVWATTLFLDSVAEIVESDGTAERGIPIEEK